MSVAGGPLGEALDEGLTDALGLSDALAELDGDTLGDGETDALSVALGESDGLTLGEPTEATERISTTPATFGDAPLSVNEPEPTVAMASND